MSSITITVWLMLFCQVAVGQTPATAPGKTAGIEAITRPSDSRTLAFVRPGLVKSILVKDGDLVKTGDVLIQLDDIPERLQMEQLKAEADDTTRIQAAQAELDQARVDLEKIQEAANRGAATQLEVEHSRLTVVIKDLSLQLAKFNQAQAKLKHDEASAMLDRMRIVSPMNGRVEGIAAKEGETVKENDRVIRLVQIDPLWLEVPVPLSQARAMKQGDPVDVRFDNGSGFTVQGSMVLVRSEADAASDTLSIRVEVPNPNGRPAGEHVTVTFPAATATNSNTSNQNQGITGTQKPKE